MAKLILDPINSMTQSAVGTINNNYDKIEAAVENTLSRDGSTPNQMDADIDMNGNDLLNVGYLAADTLTVGGFLIPPVKPVPIDMPFYDTVLLASLADIKPHVNTISTGGYRSPGDGGGALYRRVPSEPSHIGKFKSVDGSWWELSNRDVHLQQLGARADGSEDVWPYVQAMADWKGYVRFGAGEYAIGVGNPTIEVPLVFEWGAYLTVSAGNTLYIRNRIISDKQWIFRGDGDYRMRINGDGNNGEDSRHLHASWFGVFPQNNDPSIDQTARIIKLMQAFEGQGREGVIEFDNGAYRISDTIPVYRGTWVRGAGTRRTTFDIVGNFEAVFATQGVACKFTNFQFETPNELGSVVFDGVQIKIDHSDCVVEDVQLWSPRIGIQINADNAEVIRIRGTYGADVSGTVDPSLVEVNASFARIRDVRVVGTSNAPEALVRIGPNTSANIFGNYVSTVHNTEDAYGVMIDARGSFAVHSTIIEDVYMHLDSGASSAAVYIKTSDSATVHSVLVSGIIAGINCKELLRVDQGSSASVSDLVVSNSIARGTADGNAIIFNATSGSITDVVVADSVDVNDRANPITATGTVTDLRLPGRMSGFRSEVQYTVSDDAAIDVIPPLGVIGGVALVTAYGSNGQAPQVDATGLVSFRLNNATMIKLTGGTKFDAVGTDVTGTTGADGNLTLGIVVGKLRLENRLGSAQRVTITWLG